MKQFFRLHIYFILVAGIIAIASCRSTERAFINEKENMPFDAVIVPGVPYEDGWSTIMKARVLWSVYLYKNGYTKNIIYSGSAVYNPYIESRIMAAYAEKLGVEPEHIFTEERAEHSTENVFYSYYMAKDLGFDKVALATDPFQTKMVRSFAKQKKLELAFLPTIIDTLKQQVDTLDLQIDPSSAFVENFIPLPEREGFWKRFAGTMGKNLKYEPQQITDAAMKLP